jgi:hypothetical protein
MCRFLSVVTVAVSTDYSGRSVLRISSDSAAIVPAWVPLSAFLGAILCWVPFWDCGCNEQYAIEVYTSLLRNGVIKCSQPVEHTFASSSKSDLTLASAIFYVSFILLPVCCAAYILFEAKVIRFV